MSYRLPVLVCSIFCLTFVVAGRCAATPKKLGVPIITFAQYGCQGLAITVTDSTPDDEGLSDVELVFDSLGINGPALESYNVYYEKDPNQGDYVGSVSMSFHVLVFDPLKPAYAAIYAVNHAGITTVKEWHFYPVRMSLAVDSFVLDLSSGSVDTSGVISLQNSGIADVIIDSIQNPIHPQFRISKRTFPIQLPTGSSVKFTARFGAQDTTTVADTAYIFTGCYRIPVLLSGNGIVPIIDAEDVAFNGVDLDTTECKSLRVWNHGSSPLRIAQAVTGGYFLLEGNFPSSIPPGGYLDYNVCFAPKQAYGIYTRDIVWSTNEPAAYLHGQKDVSHIIGIAAVGGLHWDRVKEIYTPADGGADTLIFQIANTSSHTKQFDSLAFGGADPGDFPITNVVTTHTSETAGSMIEVDIAFRPDLHSQAAVRSATVYVVSGGLRVDSLFLNGYTGQAAVSEKDRLPAIRIYPNPVHGATLHVSSGDTQPSEARLFDMLGNAVWTLARTPPTEFEIPVLGITPGPYLLRLVYPNASISRMITISR